MSLASERSLPVQDDLFASETNDPGIDTSFSTARRTALDAQSWIEVVPAWMSGSRSLLERMRTEVPWAQHDRKMYTQTFQEPRLTAQYSNLQVVPQKILVDAARALSDHYGVEYDSLWLNFYRHGEDSTGWHRDHFSCRRDECIVPVLTLGATRRFLIKPRNGGRSIGFKPASGDLIVMGGRSQQDWVHSVPKDPKVPQARMSINFQSSQQARRDQRFTASSPAGVWFPSS